MIPAPELDFRAVLPLLLVAIGALGVLVGELLLSGRKSVLGRPVTRAWVGTALALASAAILGVVLILVIQNLILGDARIFNPARPLVVLDRLANFGILVVCLGALLSCLLSIAYLAELRINHGEYYALLLLATSGMVLLVSATDLLSVFLGIEIMSIPIYVLAGFDRRKVKSNESALKYFLVGSFASAILLYGMALLYGATGATSFSGIRAAFDPDSTLALMGLGLVLVGFTFKISAVPFHQWTPDVYEGAPAVVTGFMSVGVKAAAFVAMLRIFLDAFPSMTEVMTPIFATLAALTLVLGNVMALIQQNLKRLFAYSAIAHAGYLLLGFVSATPAAWSAVLFYLLAYLFMNLGAFAVVVALAHRGQDLDRVEDLAGLARVRPALAAAMTLFVISLAGIPGTVGFIAKFQLFAAAVEAGHIGLVILAVMMSVVSVYYYLRLPIMMFMREPGDEPPRLHLASGEWLVLAICGFAVVALGFFPNGREAGFLSWLPPVLDWSRESIAAVLALQ